MEIDCHDAVPDRSVYTIMGSKKLTAKNSDKFLLYEEAVQNVEFEAGVIRRFYKKLRDREPLTLKEDFCGSFALCCEWVQKNKAASAVGVDLEGKVLDWGRKHNLAKLKDSEKKRIQLHKDDVNNVTSPKVDIVAAFNFSYWTFRTRPELLKYFRTCYKSLKQNGILVLDAFGGSAAQLENDDEPEERECEGFTYVWEHAKFHPVTHYMECKIHFEFDDGSRMRNAFKYQWRLWNPPEITELLTEAGFDDVQWFFEGTDHKTGEGDGVYRRSLKGEAAETWLAYAVALK
jgi:SAM-dependent methyltransferase